MSPKVAALSTQQWPSVTLVDEDLPWDSDLVTWVGCIRPTGMDAVLFHWWGPQEIFMYSWDGELLGDEKGTFWNQTDLVLLPAVGMSLGHYIIVLYPVY